jgi:hypothetical protein
MAIEITSLKELAPEKIEAMFNTLSQLMQERHPEVELTRGVFHDLVLYFNGVLNAAIQENVDRVRQSNSLLSISTNPALSEPELVDQVLSNYGLVRDQGRQASGTITIVLPLAAQTTVAVETRMTAGTAIFRPTATFIILPPGSVAALATERVMQPVGDGTYVATITVQAEEIGTGGNINKGTELVPDFQPVNVSKIYATVDFVNGRDVATNENYISKLAPALAAKTIGGRRSYVAAIRANAAFADIQHISIIGAGDVEQQRDQHGLFPISGGGKVDIYLQSYPYPQTQTQLLEATYVGPGVTGGRWQIILDRDTFPALYEISRVAKPNALTTTGYKIVNEYRGVNFSELAFVPSIKYMHESAYTRYQTVMIQFEDTDTSIINLVANQSKAKYDVEAVCMPLIADVQDMFSARENRSRTTDVLVRAALPCFTKISFQIRKDANDPDPDIAAIQQAVSNKIGTIGFSGQLHASHISSVAQQLLSGKQGLGPIDMFGRIRRPDGKNVYVRDSAILQIPDDPGHLITGRTTAFMTRPEDVTISTVVAGFAY